MNLARGDATTPLDPSKPTALLGGQDYVNSTGDNYGLVSRFKL